MSTTTQPTSPPDGGAYGMPPAAVNPSDSAADGFVFPGTENVDPALVFATPGYQAPRQHTDPMASTALVCGLLSFIPLFGVAALGFGWAALVRIRRSYDVGHTEAWFGVVVGAASTVLWLWSWWLWAWWLLPYFE
ncbi:DUF4190 domain-containing protein [Actinomyces oricola]|uniref:DUF4190 domain-containing protein n=1 Tax=Actinomyces oricola TaxID=206043 RepID=UPI001F4F2CA5|nr:DUF4190 domain-containing protein [Actinomyces oricola]